MHGLAGATVKHLGLGSAETWHGGPDLRVSGCEVVNINENLEQDVFNSESDDEILPSSQSASCTDRSYRSPSPGTTVNVEGKIQINLRGHLSQLVPTCVVSSFTKSKKHPHLNPLVPTLLVNKTAFRVCMYDCENDVLLLSEPKLFTSPKGGISRTALLILWLVINHR